MKSKVEIKERIVYISLEGNILGQSDELDLVAKVEDYILTGFHHGVVDLSQAKLMNSIGLSLLIRILVKFRNAGGDLFLTHPSEEISNLLLVTKLTAIFTVVDSLEEVSEKLSDS